MDHSRPKSITAKYDDLLRRYKVLLTDDTAEKFLEYVEAASIYLAKYNGVEQELTRLQEEIVKAKMETNTYQTKLKHARQLITVERSKRMLVEKEKLDLERQVSLVVDMLGQGNVNETREKLQVLSSTFSAMGQVIDGGRVSLREVASPNALSTINEDADTMGSIINVSELDLTDAEELELSKTRSGRSYQSMSPQNRSSASRKRKSSPDKQNRSSGSRKASKGYDENKENCESIVNKLLLEKVVGSQSQGNFTPSAPPLSSDETCDVEGKSLVSFRGSAFGTPFRHHQQMPPKPPIQVFTPMGGTLYSSPGNSPLTRSYSSGKMNGRHHCFVSKTIYWTETCQACSKRIKFGKPAYKCRDCRATCHVECKDSVPLPCVPTAVTPGAKGAHLGLIADYAPPVAPMVPAIVVHCTNEVESRGLTEVGIYRVPGSDREVKDLKDRFLRGKGSPVLSSIEINVVACTMKLFLRSLKEPLIPTSLWRDFISSTEKTEHADALTVLYQAIADLPQPNRDTLAWIICHLQRVSECVECKMPTTNLARIFGPTLIGYSVPELEPHCVLDETRLQQKVMELLMEISSDYWSTFIVLPEETLEPINKFTTPEKSYPPVNTRRKSILSIREFGTPRRNSKK